MKPSLTHSLLLGSLCFAALSGCSGSHGTDTAPKPGGRHAAPAPDLTVAPNELVVISPNPRDIQVEFERIFTHKFPQAHIKWLDQGGSADDLHFVESQYAGKANSSGIGIDVFFGGGMESFLDMDKQHVLTPLGSSYGVPAQLNGLPLRGPNSSWVASVLSGFGILYNKSIATRDALPVPKVWADLGNPKLRNRITLADPRHSGSAHMPYELILQAEGWKKGWQTLTAMAGNARTFTASGAQVPNDIASGEAVMGPVIDFYASAKIAAADPGKLAYIDPAGQSVVTADPIGILRGAPHADLAKKFVDLVMSPVGQKLWMYKKGAAGGPQNSDLMRMSSLPSMYAPISPSSLIRASPFAARGSFRFDAAKAALRRQALDDLIGAVLITDQDAIKARWDKTPDPAKIAYVPVTEAQLGTLAAKWSDQAFRNATIAQWNTAVQQHLSP